MIVVGPLAGASWGALRRLDRAIRPALWVVSELPIEANPPPSELIGALRRTRRLAVVEEHVAHGGVGPGDVPVGDRGRNRPRPLSPSSCFGLPRRDLRLASFPQTMQRSRSREHRACGAGTDELMMLDIGDWVRAVRGPILVLGAGGFVGANLLRRLLGASRGRFRRRPLSPGLAPRRDRSSAHSGSRSRRSRRDAQHGDQRASAHHFQLRRLWCLFVRDGSRSDLSDQLPALVQLVELLAETDFSALVHAGSSSEYGTRSARSVGGRGPATEQPLRSVKSGGEQLHLLRRQVSPPAGRQSCGSTPSMVPSKMSPV